MATARIAESIHIDRPAPEVWDAIADYSLDLRWRSGLVEMTPDPPGPAALGTRVHEVVRSMGRSFVADTEVTAFEPGTSYDFAGEGTIGHVRGGRDVESDAGGAAFTYRIELQPTGAMRAIGPVLGPVVRSGLKKDLQKLKELLESGA